MRPIFVIQDVITKEYFWQYRIEEGFNSDVTEATIFYTEEEAVNKLKENILKDLFESKIIEVRKFYQ